MEVKIEKQKLYLVKSKGFRGYVVAMDTNTAWEKFKNYLDSLGLGGCSYGTYEERRFDSIQIVADSDAYKPKTANGMAYDDAYIDDVLIV